MLPPVLSESSQLQRGGRAGPDRPPLRSVQGGERAGGDRVPEPGQAGEPGVPQPGPPRLPPEHIAHCLLSFYSFIVVVFIHLSVDIPFILYSVLSLSVLLVENSLITVTR